MTFFMARWLCVLAQRAFIESTPNVICSTDKLQVGERGEFAGGGEKLKCSEKSTFQ